MMFEYKKRFFNLKYILNYQESMDVAQPFFVQAKYLSVLTFFLRQKILLNLVPTSNNESCSILQALQELHALSLTHI